jgi:hypothetical protein
LRASSCEMDSSIQIWMTSRISYDDMFDLWSSTFFLFFHEK